MTDMKDKFRKALMAKATTVVSDVVLANDFGAAAAGQPADKKQTAAAAGYSKSKPRLYRVCNM